jgi:hypothetical protein
MKKPSLAPPPPPAIHLDNIQAFLDGTRGQITIGEIPPIHRAALAAEGKKVRAALVGRDENETILELLLRLDAALDHYCEKGVVIDEVLPEIQRRRAARSK